MADGSAIEWTDATWNPVRGCSRISAGCGGPNHRGGCYAETIAARFSGPGQPFEGLAERTPHGGRWTGRLAAAPDETLTQPLRWKRPRRIFVNSMSDLFHEALPVAIIDRVFAVMALSPWHIYQILTKRAGLMQAYFDEPHPADNVRAWQVRVCAMIDELVPNRTDASRAAKDRVLAGPLPNVWLGVSTEDQPTADERIPHLLATPAGTRFISAEPLLGALDLAGRDMLDGADNLNALTGQRDNAHGKKFYGPKLDWVIAGGESGHTARPMHPDWARSLRDQCAAAKVPFFFKQWGEWAIDRTMPIRLTPTVTKTQGE